MTRLRYAVLIALTIVLGLASRRYATLLPWWLAKNAGDILYATMAYWLFRFFRPEAMRRHSYLSTIVFCFVIEFGQLWHPPWLETIRHTRLGGLVLGFGFHATDLLCYLLGAALGILLDRGIIPRDLKPVSNTSPNRRT